MQTQLTVNFSEIFHFATDNHGISWNECNDLFFNTILEYKRFNIFYLEDLEYDMEYIETNVKEKEANYLKASKILIEFMKQNNLTEMLVLNN